MALFLAGIAGSVFITTCGTLGATVVTTLVVFVAVVVALFLKVSDVLAAVVVAIVALRVVVVGVSTADVNCSTLYFQFSVFSLYTYSTYFSIDSFLHHICHQIMSNRSSPRDIISAFAATGLGLGWFPSGVFLGHSHPNYQCLHTSSNCFSLLY